jgi:uncharacterized membrane protein YhhN
MCQAAPVESSLLVGVLAVLTALAALADWWSVARGRKDLETWLKPAVLVLLVATVLAAGALDHTPGVWLVVALVLGLVGDVALLDDTVEQRFVAGLAAFLLGHLAYVVCFAVLGLALDGRAVVAAAVIAVALVLGRADRILAGARRDGGPALVGPVVVYMLVIAAMTVTGWETGSWWIAAGASVFVGSDTILAHNKFVRPLAWARPAIMVTYHVGQALIAVGVLRMMG